MTTPQDDAPQKSCGCTGVRWCANCVDPRLRELHRMDPPIRLPDFLSTRPEVSKSMADRFHDFDLDSQCAPSCPAFRGVFVFREFYSKREADRLLEELEKTPFGLAQSGKQKQHYGSKVNFNKQKINYAGFKGLPAYARHIEDRLRALLDDRIDNRVDAADQRALRDALDKFETTDVFVLRYHERDQSSLDFHQDDRFAYGETILDFSLESDSVLTFLDGRPEDSRSTETKCVRVPLPARSLAVLFGSARFDWEHAILPYDIANRRTSITLRTLSECLRASDAGAQILAIARGDANPC
jgi:alkylated DNA repair protein alkB family protein 4